MVLSAHGPLVVVVTWDPGHIDDKPSSGMAAMACARKSLPGRPGGELGIDRRYPRVIDVAQPDAEVACRPAVPGVEVNHQAAEIARARANRLANS
jgi:hypothetical protein